MKAIKNFVLQLLKEWFKIPTFIYCFEFVGDKPYKIYRQNGVCLCLPIKKADILELLLIYNGVYPQNLNLGQKLMAIDAYNKWWREI